MRFTQVSNSRVLFKKGLTKDDKKRLNCGSQCCNMIVDRTRRKPLSFELKSGGMEIMMLEKTLEGIDMFSGFRHKRKREKQEEIHESDNTH